MDPRLKKHLVQTVTIEPYVGPSFDGTQSTYGTAVTYAARIVGKMMDVRSTFVLQVGATEDVAPTFTIYVDGNNATRITTRDRLTVPEPYRPDGVSGVKIFTVAFIPDDDGIAYVKISAGWMYHRQGSF